RLSPSSQSPSLVLVSCSVAPFLFHPYVPPPYLPSFPTRRSSDLLARGDLEAAAHAAAEAIARLLDLFGHGNVAVELIAGGGGAEDRKSTRLNSSHVSISYAVFCLKKKKKIKVRKDLPRAREA